MIEARMVGKPPMKMPSAKPDDQLVTRGMLKAATKELRSEIIASEKRLELKFSGLKGEFAGLRSDFAELKAFVTAALASIEVKVNRSNVLAEEQRGENRMVLDGLFALWERQERHERYTGFIPP